MRHWFAILLVLFVVAAAAFVVVGLYLHSTEKYYIEPGSSALSLVVGAISALWGVVVLRRGVAEMSYAGRIHTQAALGGCLGRVVGVLALLPVPYVILCLSIGKR